MLVKAVSIHEPTFIFRRIAEFQYLRPEKGSLVILGNDFPSLPQQKKPQLRVPDFPEPHAAQMNEARPSTQAGQPARPSTADEFPTLSSQAAAEARQRQGDAAVSSSSGISEALKAANKVWIPVLPSLQAGDVCDLDEGQLTCRAASRRRGARVSFRLAQRLTIRKSHHSGSGLEP